MPQVIEDTSFRLGADMRLKHYKYLSVVGLVHCTRSRIASRS